MVLAGHTMAESVAAVVSTRVPEIMHWVTIAGTGLICAATIVHMKMVKRYPNNSEVSSKVGRQLLFACGVVLFFSGVVGIVAKVLMWFSSGLLLAWTLLGCGVLAMAIYVALQVNDAGLGVYLPEGLQHSLMRSSLLALLIDRTMMDQLMEMWRRYKPKMMQILRVLIADEGTVQFQAALDDMDPDLRRMLQREGTVYLLPDWMQQVLLPRRVRLSPEYLELRRLREQRSQLIIPHENLPPTSGDIAASSMFSTLTSASSLVNSVKIFLANKVQDALSRVRGRVLMVGAITGAMATVQISTSKRTRKWLLASTVSMMFLACAAISGGAGVLLLLQRRFRRITNALRQQQSPDYRPRRTRSVPEIVDLGMRSVFDDILSTRPRDMTIGFFCLSLVIYLFKQRPRFF